jgi:TIR domain
LGLDFLNRRIIQFTPTRFEFYMATVFFSYSHVDEEQRNQLEKHLKILKRQGVIESWHDRMIGAGNEWKGSIDHHLENDDIILLLISPDFLASDYCYDVEMLRAIERHDSNDAIVIPIFLRPCLWQGAPFAKIQGVPTDARPVTKWANPDEAMLDVATGIKIAAERVNAAKNSVSVSSRASTERHTDASSVTRESNFQPRSSNLHVTKEFTERDRDQFLMETFEYIARYFEGSLLEIAKRHDNIEGHFRKLDANRFTAAAYREGKKVAKCTIFVGERMTGGGIGYGATDDGASNSFNANLIVSHDEQSMFMTDQMAGYSNREISTKLSQEGAASHFWDSFIEPLQRKTDARWGRSL